MQHKSEDVCLLANLHSYPHLGYPPQLWVVTKRMRSWMNFLQMVMCFWHIMMGGGPGQTQDILSWSSVIRERAVCWHHKPNPDTWWKMGGWIDDLILSVSLEFHIKSNHQHCQPLPFKMYFKIHQCWVIQCLRIFSQSSFLRMDIVYQKIFLYNTVSICLILCSLLRFISAFIFTYHNE